MKLEIQAIHPAEFTCSIASIIDFEQISVCWAKISYYNVIKYPLTSK